MRVCWFFLFYSPISCVSLIDRQEIDVWHPTPIRVKITRYKCLLKSGPQTRRSSKITSHMENETGDCPRCCGWPGILLFLLHCAPIKLNSSCICFFLLLERSFKKASCSCSHQTPVTCVIRVICWFNWSFVWMLVDLHTRHSMFGKFFGAWVELLWKFAQRSFYIGSLRAKLKWHAKRC